MLLILCRSDLISHALGISFLPFFRFLFSSEMERQRLIDMINLPMQHIMRYALHLKGASCARRKMRVSLMLPPPADIPFGPLRNRNHQKYARAAP